MTIEHGDDLYNAIEEAIYKIFNEEIELNDPSKTTELVVESINKDLKILNDLNMEEEE